ncbi:MAG: hypothetical protein ACP5IC_01605 [Minisyncoccia bacterium]
MIQGRWNKNFMEIKYQCNQCGYLSDNPGVCPICDIELVKVELENSNHIDTDLEKLLNGNNGVTGNNPIAEHKEDIPKDNNKD